MNLNSRRETIDFTILLVYQLNFCRPHNIGQSQPMKSVVDSEENTEKNRLKHVSTTRSVRCCFRYKVCRRATLAARVLPASSDATRPTPCRDALLLWGRSLASTPILQCRPRHLHAQSHSQATSQPTLNKVSFCSYRKVHSFHLISVMSLFHN